MCCFRTGLPWSSYLMSPSDFWGGLYVVEFVAGKVSVHQYTFHCTFFLLSFWVTSVKMVSFKKAEDRIKTELCNEEIRGWEYMTLFNWGRMRKKLRWSKCLPCKSEGLNLNAQNLHKRWDHNTYLYLWSQCSYHEMWSQDKRIPWSSWDSWPGLGRLKQKRDPILNKS